MNTSLKLLADAEVVLMRNMVWKRAGISVSALVFWILALIPLMYTCYACFFDMISAFKDHSNSSMETGSKDDKIIPAEDFVAKYKNPPWEEKTVDEALRMEINGETEAQMLHAKKLKEEGPKDTSVDQEWEIDESLASVDKYVLITSAIWIIPKVLLFAVPLFLAMLPYYTLARLYAKTLPEPTDYVRRSTSGFIIVMEFFGRVLLLPAYYLRSACLLLDYAMYYIFSVPFCLIRYRGFDNYYKSQKVIDPYRHGPATRVSDLMVASLGQTTRNGAIYCAYCYAGTCLLLPWIKYYINANPFIYPLEERFVQQISTSLKDCGLHKVVDTSRVIISRSRQEEHLADVEHMWDFIPHYPYPPPGRRWANGLQHVGKYFHLWVHTTHAIGEANGSTEQFILSNSVAMPVYRVMLWYSNPYHFFSGFVEASISTGEPSQPDKMYGGEHPMWLITSRSPLLSSRDSSTGVGMIDAFFDYWLPDFVDCVRGLILGPEVAQKMHQEVISKDGASRPAPPSAIADDKSILLSKLKVEA